MDQRVNSSDGAESATSASEGDSDIVTKLTDISDKLTSPIKNISDKLTSPLKTKQHGGKRSRGTTPKSSEHGVTSASSADQSDATGTTHDGDSPSVAPDQAIAAMDRFVNETLTGVSVQDYYDTIWSDSTKNGFYASWLAKSGKMNINMSDWEVQNEDADTGFVGPLDGEAYAQRRVVTFTTKRSGIGPPTAEVTQVHLCRTEGTDKCVVSINIDMKVPFGDAFSVSVRWVASRSGSKNLAVQCGMKVVFHKSCFVESKIRSNTTTETKKGQGNLFTNMREKFGSALTQEDAKGAESKMPNNSAEAAPAASTASNERYATNANEGTSPVRGDSRPCWFNVCSFLGLSRERPGPIAEPPPAEFEDIILNLCMCHYKLGKVHERVLSGCCSDADASLIRSELSKIDSSLSKISD